MVTVELKQYIELQDDNPLSAVIAGTHYNTWLVAANAREWSIDHAIEQYHLSRAEVHAALAFYYENEAAIEAAHAEHNKKYASNSVDGWGKLEEMKMQLRQKNSDES